MTDEQDGGTFPRDVFQIARYGFGPPIKRYRAVRETDCFIICVGSSGREFRIPKSRASEPAFYSFEEAKAALIEKREEALKSLRSQVAGAEDRVKRARALTEGDVG